MDKEDLENKLAENIPSELALDLVTNFVKIKSDVATKTLERASPGKFIETVVQVLQFLDTSTYEKKPAIDDYLKNIENKSKILSDDLRIILARVARSCYTLRNKRNIAHKGDIDPNIYDLHYLFSASQWILSEIVRIVLFTDIKTANTLISQIQTPVIALVEDFGERRLVLKEVKALDELILDMYSYYPNYISISQIYKDLSRRPKSTVSHTISSAYEKRYIDGNKQKGYVLTRIGYDLALRLISQSIESK